MFTLIVVQFECSLRFYHLEFDREAISDGFMAHFLNFQEGKGGGGEFWQYLRCLWMDLNVIYGFTT